MSTYSIRRKWAVCAYLGPLVCGLGTIATSADAQNAAAPATSLAASSAAQGGAAPQGGAATQGGDWAADAKLKRRVKAALHSSHLYDRHVTVSIEGDSVVLRGFVFSDWDLEDALRVARKAAGDRPVIDNLSIKEGGR